MDLVFDSVMFEKLGGESESPHGKGGESSAQAHPREDDAALAVDEDALLMLEVKAGNAQAFSTLVLRYKDSIYNLAVKMLGDTSDAEDIAQQVFIRVWQSAARYEVKSKFTTWL